MSSFSLLPPFLVLRPSSWRPIGRRHVCNENGVANLGFSTTAFWLRDDKTLHLGSWRLRKAKRFRVSPGNRSFFRKQSCNQFGVTYIILAKTFIQNPFIVEWRSSLQIKSNISVILSHRFPTWKFHFGFAIGSFNEKQPCGRSGKKNTKTVAFQKGVSWARILYCIHSIGWSKAGPFLVRF